MSISAADISSSSPQAPQADDRPIGIIGALPEEIAGLIAQLALPPAAPASDTVGRPVATTLTLGSRDFHHGCIDDIDCVAVLSRIGKVAAAATASILIHRFDVRAILFVGVAGGMADTVRVGDIVIGSQFIQHDMDASPLFPRFEIPLLGTRCFAADSEWSARLHRAAQGYLASRVDGEHAVDAMADASASARPQVHVGLIGSGDRFVSGANERARLREALPALLAVDMESAAVAQVCVEHGVPFAAMRSISDSADDGAAVDFPMFLREVAAVYADGVLRAVFAAHRAERNDAVR
ncbi:5'-methylthioadenosine/adenosylhomocysteine nucleosidase [Robbsia sp. KACC 23696]|uniref:5'-methylthioadenosine/adenosylhomocysteine nucleosidase n=1 Tax=Robbsia sp. KACC 23696 TaxID=3149231 RepID=UPI00325BA929